MKKFITAAIAASMLAASAMSASAVDWNHNNNGRSNYSHSDNDRHDNNGNNGHSQMRHHGWRQGGYLPTQYRRNTEVNWRAHHLRQPPRGSHWVQTDGDYVLVALTTGLILSAIANAN